MTDLNNTNNSYNKDKNDIPLTQVRDNEEQVCTGGLSPKDWPTCAESRPLRLRRDTKLKIEGSCRTTPLFKRKGTSPHGKRETKKSPFTLVRTLKVLVKRVENYEGLVNIISHKGNEPAPGTSDAAKTEPVPTGVQLPGTSGPALETPVPTGEILPGTASAVETTQVPTGELTGMEAGESENLPSTSYTLPRTQGTEDTTVALPEEDEDDDKTVKMSIDEEEEVEVEVVKRKRGRPPTTFQHIGARQKREAREKARRERELEDRAQRILDPTIPRGRRWEAFREREEELRKELSNAPTLDLQMQVMESTALMFKAADCSSKMKGSVVHALKEAAANTRATMLVLAGRVRGTETSSGPSERESYLELQIEELKRKVGKLEKRPTLPPPESPTSNLQRKRAKRRKAIIESDEDWDVTAPSTSRTVHFPPPQAGPLPQEEKREDMKASHDGSRYCDGPSLKGKIRQVEAYPPGVRPQDRAEYDELAKQRAVLAGRQNIASVDPTKVKEYVAIRTQMQDIAARMDTLRMYDEMERSHSMPHTTPSQGREEAKAPSPKKWRACKAWRSLPPLR